MTDKDPSSRTKMPPQNMRFVVANDPDQFRDRNTMTSNSSHMMQSHLMERRHRQTIRTSPIEEPEVHQRSRSATSGRAITHSNRASRSPHPPLSSFEDQSMSSKDARLTSQRDENPDPQRRMKGIAHANTSPLHRR